MTATTMIGAVKILAAQGDVDSSWLVTLDKVGLARVRLVRWPLTENALLVRRVLAKNCVTILLSSVSVTVWTPCLCFCTFFTSGGRSCEHILFSLDSFNIHPQRC